MHADDPDAIPLSSPDAIAYAERIAALGARAPEPGLSLSYGPDRGQRLDVYATAGAEGLPVLLFFHGGAWVSGHLGWLRFMAPAALANGFVLVAGSYRLAPRCRWPAQIEDVREALWLVHRHAASWGGDPGRIAVGGHSAGGHLSALLALRRDRPDIAACLPVSASFDLRYGDVPLESDAGRVYRHLFANRSQDAEASPLPHAADADRPFHIVWGGNDLDRVARSSERMVAALEAEGRPATFQVRPGANHFDTHLALADPEDRWYARLRALAGESQGAA